MQQQRVAAGLRSTGDELRGMAESSNGQTVASDVVRQAADRATSVAAWLENRDPGSLLEEVKQFARRRPGPFIAIAIGTGIVAGRLTRALAESTMNESGSPDARTSGVRSTSTDSMSGDSMGASGMTGSMTGGAYSTGSSTTGSPTTGSPTMGSTPTGTGTPSSTSARSTAAGSTNPTTDDTTMGLP